MVAGGVYPGWCGWVGAGGVLYRYPTQPVPGPNISIFEAEGPTHGQMKAFLEVSLRFPRKGLERVPELTRIDLRIGPR